MQSNVNIKKMVKLSVMAAISYVLMLISFPIIPIAPYMKLDLSDLPILIAAISMGISSGIIVVSVKSIIYWLTIDASVSGLIGISSSWIASVTLLLAMAITLRIMKNYSNKIKWITAICLSTILLIIIMSLLNLFIVTPLYINMLGLKLSFSISKIVAVAVIPFNLIKGLVVGFLIFAIYPRLKNIVK